MTEPTPTPKPKTPSASDDETVVLASMIYEKTAAFTAKLCYAAKLDPEAMFTDTKTRDNYFALKHQGPAIFAGYLSGVPVEHIAAADDLENRIRRIVRRYKRKLAETDRTLDTFETPGPDKDDPDCLFQNRWLRRGACGSIVSTSGVGKSSFSMQAATVWAGGQECLGVRPLHPLKIGVFQSEDDEYDVAYFRNGIRKGLDKELGWTAEQIQQAESRVTFCALDGSTGARFVEYVRQKQLLHRFDLIIINPLFAFFGADLNDGAKMTEFLRHGIDPLIKAEETKCGCIIIHHTGKPNRDAMQQGDVFKAYLGSGSGEFTNYIRSALVITPWNNGKLAGVFDLIAAKHGDKLGWRDADGKPTTKKTVCYANRLPGVRRHRAHLLGRAGRGPVRRIEEERHGERQGEPVRPRRRPGRALRTNPRRTHPQGVDGHHAPDERRQGTARLGDEDKRHGLYPFDARQGVRHHARPALPLEPSSRQAEQPGQRLPRRHVRRRQPARRPQPRTGELDAVIFDNFA